MLVTEEGSSILVYGQGGRLVYKSIKIVQYAKLSATSLVIITDESIDYVKEVEVDGRKDILVVNDVNFTSAIIHNDLVFVQRKIIVPILDIYDSELNNIVRLYQNIMGKWVYRMTLMGIPYKSLEPTHYRHPNHLFTTSKEVKFKLDLLTNKLTTGNFKGNLGVPLTEALAMFNK